MNPKPSDENDPLSAEIDAALDGVHLQDLDAKQRAAPSKNDDREHKRGTIVGISGNDVFVEIGPRMQGVLSLSEFETPPKVGATFEFRLHGLDDELWRLSRRAAPQAAAAAGESVEVGALVKARITGQNTGGLEAKLGNLTAFMPASQSGVRQGENLAALVGQTLLCKVLEVDPAKRRVVISRRAVLDQERDVARTESVGRISAGQKLSGKVTRIEQFGAFVDLGGGLEGLLHVSQISHKRVENPAEVLKQGETVEVLVLEIQEGGKRISLSRKALEPDPWADAARRYSVDQVIEGKVTRVSEFGAFVELEPGIEGLLHVSQMGKERVRRAGDLFKPGQSVSVRISAIEPDRNRISLSRIDSRGAILGSEDSVDAAVINEALRTTPAKPLGTSLGALFKKLDKPT